MTSANTQATEIFLNKRVLFIPSESYCAATITIIQGLEDFGFEIVTLYKPNINSWFCNKVIKDPERYFEPAGIDFVISNLHWGTRWDHYEKFGLLNHTKILIDGDDSRLGQTWHERYRGWCSQYRKRPEESICLQRQQPYRWMEPLGRYMPDVIFSAQKAKHDRAAHYLPFGLHREYLEHAENIPFHDRVIDFANIPGDGPKRNHLSWFLRTNADRFPGVVHNRPALGQWQAHPDIYQFCSSDPNIHSWHRWRIYPAYWQILNDTKVLIYPGIFDFPQWDSKRQWEAAAVGCFVLMSRPTVDDSAYPVSAMCEFAIYDTDEELVEKCNYLYNNPNEATRMRNEQVMAISAFYNPKVLAARVLGVIEREL